jgi:ABC-2 type transport system permease protein
VLIVGFRPESWALLPAAFIFIVLTALVFTAIGTAIATKLEDMQAFPIIMNFLVMPLFFLSGSLFPIESFPRSVEIATRFNPLFYGVDGLRRSLLEPASAALIGDAIILAFIAAILIAIGGYLFSKMEA